jgi:hypothetical protein
MYEPMEKNAAEQPDLRMPDRETRFSSSDCNMTGASRKKTSHRKTMEVKMRRQREE